MNKKTIVIDMDDTITSETLTEIINEYMHTNYKDNDFSTFYKQDVLPDKESFFKYFLTKNEYDYGKINDDAISVIKLLNEKYEVFIGTSFIFREIVSESGILVKNKYDFLMKNFPFLNPMNFIFVGNKSIIKSDIKIDDKIENLINGDVKILYSAYHNRNISDKELKKLGIIRANNWLEIKKILLEDKEENNG